MAKYKRVLLKLSGESLMGEKQYGIDEKRLAEYAAQIKEIHEQGVQIRQGEWLIPNKSKCRLPG